MTYTVSEDPLGLDTYGYPKIMVLSDNWVRVSLGWFFPDLDPDEPACYIDFYFHRYGFSFIRIDYWAEIQFYYEIESLREDVLENIRWILHD